MENKLENYKQNSSNKYEQSIILFYENEINEGKKTTIGFYTTRNANNEILQNLTINSNMSTNFLFVMQNLRCTWKKKKKEKEKEKLIRTKKNVKKKKTMSKIDERNAKGKK